LMAKGRKKDADRAAALSLDLSRTAHVFKPKIMEVVNNNPLTSQEIGRRLFGERLEVGVFHREWQEAMTALHMLAEDGELNVSNIGEHGWSIPTFAKRGDQV